MQNCLITVFDPRFLFQISLNQEYEHKGLRPYHNLGGQALLEYRIRMLEYSAWLLRVHLHLDRIIIL